jgi:uncharacterized protein YprB with RNaseH-like and TPR domain
MKQARGATFPTFAERLSRARSLEAPQSALDQLPAEIAARLSHSLADRLRRVTRVGSRPGSAPGDSTPAAGSCEVLASRLGGVVAAPGLVRLDTSLALPQRLGRVCIRAGSLDRPCLDALGLAVARDAADMLFIDAETSGLGTGTGTVAFMIGAARIEREAIRLTQWVLAGFSGEPAMLDALTSVTRGCAALASYNGKTFDVPLLRARLGLWRRPDPFVALAHADLLHSARRLARRLPSTPDLRLASIEDRWLGSERVGDVPGSAAPPAWRRWLTERDAQGLREILDHNRRDLIALAALTVYAGSILAGLFAQGVESTFAA